ncbi:MAG TPA: FHA domain-containing protein [Nitrospiraceae bacterium]|nr:FHA domain-containing protein [Nitrospiraceae bacterium]
MPHAGKTCPRLIVKSPQGTAEEIELAKPSFKIGRKTDNDLCLEDPAVSGYHAKVVKIQEVLFLEDLASTNGTFINDRKIDRKQLQDADVIKIGLYRMIYRQEPASADMPVSSRATPDTDKTVVFSSSVGTVYPPASQSIGLIRVLSGKTDQTEYRLTKQLSVIGTQEDAVIRLTGWFAPKVAAIIARRPQGYLVTMAEGGKAIFVNDMPVKGQALLNEGDVIDVAGVKLYFSTTERAA